MAATKIDPNFKPSERTLELLEGREPRFVNNHDFIMHCIPEFILYFEETGVKKKAWGSTFINWVLRSWESNRHNRRWESSNGFANPADLFNQEKPEQTKPRKYIIPQQPKSKPVTHSKEHRVALMDSLFGS